MIRATDPVGEEGGRCRTLFRPYADTVARTVLIAILVVPFARDRHRLLAFGVGLRDRPARSRSTSRCRSAISIMSAASASIAAIATPAVETSPVAGVPPTHTCMTCHSQLYTQAAMLAPVRESLADRQPIHWNKVNRLPGLRLFRSFDPHRQRRRLHHLSRRRRHHAADAAGGATDDGLVPRLPSRSGAESAARRRSFRSRLAGARRPGRARQ